MLKVYLEVPVEKIHEYIARQYIKGPSIVRDTLQAVVEDAYKRLIASSIEREVRNELTEKKAEEQAIRIFSENLRNLLLQPPVKGNVVLGVDPAYRTGCKLAVVDETGKMLEVAVTYPTPPNNKVAEAKAKFKSIIEKYGVQLIVIGNGTASRETEQFVAELIGEMKKPSLHYIIVSEAGAACIRRPSLRRESSRIWTWRSEVRFPSREGCRIRSPSWSKSNQKRSGSASISMTCRRSGWTRA